MLCLAADYYAAEHEGLRPFDKAVFYRGCLHAEARLPPEALEAARGGVLLTIWSFDESVVGYCGLEKGGGAVCDVEEVPLYCRYADPLADAMVCRSRGWPLKLRCRLARLLAGMAEAFSPRGKVASYLVAVDRRKRKPILAAHRETRLTHQPPRVAPRDYERLAASTREALRRREGWQPVRQLATVIEELGMALVFRGAVRSAETGSGKPVPVARFYHPLMHWQWASFLAENLAPVLGCTRSGEGCATSGP